MPPERKDLGDFQTPLPLATATCSILKQKNIDPEVVIEPTCGAGNFVIAAFQTFTSLKEVHCIEIQPSYEELFWKNMARFASQAKIELVTGSIFTHEFNAARFTGKRVLVLGNPPWVTNSELSRLNSENVPRKSNIKKVKGIEAMTGKGNFDIAESIIIHLVKQLEGTGAWLSLFCKSSVIKSIVRDARTMGASLGGMEAYEIDAKHEFGITASGALFVARLSSEPGDTCRIASFYEPELPIKKIGWIGNRFVSNIDLYRSRQDMDGQSPFEWRQGVKNDAAKIMVLNRDGSNLLVNGFGEPVDIEADLVFPFVKGSALNNQFVTRTQQCTIITQTRLGEDTACIAAKQPRTWHYLVNHCAVLESRKSAMYKNKPRFSLFGIGNYAFKPYKIAICSFYKKPRFSLVCPVDKKPSMLDDTCYYISFDDIDSAILVLAALDSPEVIPFLEAITFSDGKRVYSKEILMRLNIYRLLERAGLEEKALSLVREVDDAIKLAISPESLRHARNTMLASRLAISANIS